VMATGLAAKGRSSLKIAVMAQDGGKPPRHAVTALRLRAPAPTQTRHLFGKEDYR
jgi:hypothetical protein